MTTTANKRGMRASAMLAREKHAQRNPQPARHTTAVIADEAARNMAGAVAHIMGTDKETVYGRMTVPELRARLEALGGKAKARDTKGTLMNAILAAERAAKTAAKPAEDDTPQLASDEDTEYLNTWVGDEEEVQESHEEAPSAHVAEPAVTLDGARKGLGKAERVQEALYPHKWNLESRGSEGNRVTLVMTRGAEVLTVVWDGGVFNYDETAHLVGDRHTKVRNVSAAIKLGSRPVEAAEADLSRVVANKRFKPSAPRGVPSTRSRLPFDPAEVSDDLLWHAVMGKTIEWVNRVSNNTETAVVSKNPKFWRVLGEGAERTVQFTTEEGFRACKLSQIVRVGGSARRRTQPKDVTA